MLPTQSPTQPAQAATYWLGRARPEWVTPGRTGPPLESAGCVLSDWGVPADAEDASGAVEAASAGAGGVLHVGSYVLHTFETGRLVKA